MEKDEQPLEQSLALYEEGVGLMKQCVSALDRAEQKVRKLQIADSGEVTQVPFAPGEDGK